MMKLLFAEDERSLSRAITHILEKNCYSVDAVYDGQAALEYLENGDYDGVILDIMMPKADGITVLRELRSKGNHVPVLMLTAKSEIDDRVLGLDTGANDYLTKPFDTKELLARIRAMTRSHRAMDTLLTVGSITLDRANFELSSSSGSFRLANKEYQMMELLMANPKQVISSNRFFSKSGDTWMSESWTIRSPESAAGSPGTCTAVSRTGGSVFTLIPPQRARAEAMAKSAA